MHAYADPRSSARDRAFERLYRRYVKDVYRYTLALLRNPADAEDITQTTFLNAYRAYKRGEEPISPHNWLIKIAHNACRTRYLRARRRPQEVPLEDSLRELAVPVQEIPNVKDVLDALARLPFNQRAALVMRELDGRSYAEISQALDVSVPAVETLIFRARRSLRVRRSALRTLAVLPLPGSLSSFSSGSAALGGGALLGSGLLLKAVFAVGVGVVAGGAGTAVQAKVLGPDAGVAGAARPPLVAAPTGGVLDASATAATVALRGAKLRTAGAEGSAVAGRPAPRTAEPDSGRDGGDRAAPSEARAAQPSPGGVAVSTQSSAGAAAPAAAAPASTVETVTTTVRDAAPALPAVPSAPAVPAAEPVALPPVPEVPPTPAPPTPPSLPVALPPLPPPPSLP